MCYKNNNMSDLRSAFRALRAAPVVTFVVVLSLACGIGANTAIFSVVHTLLLRTLPVTQPDRLVALAPNSLSERWSNHAWTEIHARRNALFDDALAFSSTRFNLSPRGPSDHVDGLLASGRYFEMLGVQPVIGRIFTEEDDREDGGRHGPVALLSYAFWQQRFGGASVIGRTLQIERVAYTIVGVMPPAFFGLEVGRTFDVAVPLNTDRLISRENSFLDRYGVGWLRIFARLKEGQSVAAAEQAFRGVQPQIREATRNPREHPAFREQHLKAPFQISSAAIGASTMRGAYRQPVLVSMAFVVVLVPAGFPLAVRHASIRSACSRRIRSVTGRTRRNGRGRRRARRSPGERAACSAQAASLIIPPVPACRFRL